MRWRSAEVVLEKISAHWLSAAKLPSSPTIKLATEVSETRPGLKKRRKEGGRERERANLRPPY